METTWLADCTPGDAALAAAHYAPKPSNWMAELALWFEARDGKTRLMRRRHLGPLVVQRPFHPEADGTCHVYLLHPPGGVAGGDQLDMKFHLGPGARVLFTTPGATKFYRSVHARSEQRTGIDVGAGAICEYLPQETILFDGADAAIDTRVSLAEEATYVGWDFMSFGRPAAGERFENGAVRQRTEIRRGGKLVWFERLHIPGGSVLNHASYALAGKPIVGTMVHVGPAPENAAELVRGAIGQQADGVFSVSQLEQVVVCRYLGPRMSEGKALFMRAWDALRKACQAKPANAPRIWVT